MYVTVLDVRGTHVNNPDCPMRIAQTPRGGWVCLDCGFEILQKRVNYHQFTETVRGVLKMLEVVDDPHGVVHRARELLKIELREVGVLHDDRHILNTHFYDGLEPDELARRMGAKRKQCHGRPPVSSPISTARAASDEEPLGAVKLMQQARVPAFMEPEGYERLTKGTLVRTTKDAGRGDWMTTGSRQYARWGVRGVVIQHHDSHGLCYDVQHEDGTESCYDPDELKVLKPTDNLREHVAGMGADPHEGGTR